MKRFILTLTAIILFVAVLLQPIVSNTIFSLLFLGVIPGTDMQLPSWAMLVFYGLVAVLMLRWLIAQPLYVGTLSKQEQTARRLARKKITGNRSHTTRRRTAQPRTRRRSA